MVYICSKTTLEMSILDELQKEASANPVVQPTQDNVSDAPIAEPTTQEDVVAETETVVADDAPVNHNVQPQELSVEQTELPKSQFASEEVAEFNAFKQKFPDKSIDDYKRLKTPTNEVSEEELLRQYYSEEEGMGEKEIAYQLKQLELNADGDDDFGDFSLNEDEKLKREANRERDLRKAKKWHENYVKEQLSFDQGGTEQNQQQTAMTAEDFRNQLVEQSQKARENYLTSVYSTLTEIKDIPLNVGGEVVSFVPDEDFRKEMRAVSESPETAYTKYQNEDGSFKDYKGFITDVALWANPTTREKLIEFRVEQAILRDRVAQNKERRNVSGTANIGVNNNGNESETAFEQFYAEKRRHTF